MKFEWDEDKKSINILFVVFTERKDTIRLISAIYEDYPDYQEGKRYRCKRFKDIILGLFDAVSAKRKAGYEFMAEAS